MEKNTSPGTADPPPAAVKSVWGVPLQTHVELPSLHDVMSEQLAKDLLEKEEQSELKKILEEIQFEDVADYGCPLIAEAVDPPASFSGNVESEEAFFDEDEAACADDLLIAQMLQLQFDKVCKQKNTQVLMNSICKLIFKHERNQKKIL